MSTMFIRRKDTRKQPYKQKKIEENYSKKNSKDKKVWGDNPRHISLSLSSFPFCRFIAFPTGSSSAVTEIIRAPKSEYQMNR